MGFSKTGLQRSVKGDGERGREGGHVSGDNSLQRQSSQNELIRVGPNPSSMTAVLLKGRNRGTWVAQSVVERPISAQVVISRFVTSSPASGSVLTAQGLEPAWDPGSPSLSGPPRLMLCLSLSQKQINIKKNV